MPSPTPSGASFGYLSIGYKTAFASEHLQQQQSSVSDDGEENEMTDLAEDFHQLAQSRHPAEARQSCEPAQQGSARCLVYVEPLKRAATENGQRLLPIAAVTSDSETLLSHCCGMTHNSEELLETHQQQEQQQQEQQEAGEKRDFSSEEEELLKLPEVTHSTDDFSSVPDKTAAAASTASRVEDQSSSEAKTASDQRRQRPSVRFSQLPSAVFAIESQLPEMDSALASEEAPQPTTSASQHEVTVTLANETAVTAPIATSLPVQTVSESSSSDATYYAATRRQVTPPSSSEASEELGQCQMKSLQEFVNATVVKASAKSSPVRSADQSSKWSADRTDKLTAVKSILKQPKTVVDPGATELQIVTAQNCQPVTSSCEEAADAATDTSANQQPPPDKGRRASSVKFADKRHVKEVSTSVLDQPVKRSAKRSAAKAASKRFAVKQMAQRSAAKPADDSRQPVKTKAPEKQQLMEKAGMLRVRKSLGEADVVLLAKRRTSVGSKSKGGGAADKTATVEEVYMYDEDSEPYMSEATSRSSLTAYLMQLLRLGDFSNAKEFGAITKDAKSRLAFIALISPEVREMFGFYAATVGKIARLTGCRVRLKRAILNRKTNGSGTWARFAQIEIEGVRPRSAAVCDRLLRERFRCYEDRRPLRQEEGKAVSIMPLGASWDSPDDQALAFVSQRTKPKSASPGPNQEDSGWDAAASTDNQYRLISADSGPVEDDDSAACDN